MDVHPSDIPCCMTLSPCKQEPSAPTFVYLSGLIMNLYLFWRNSHSCRICHLTNIIVKKNPEQTYEAQSSLHSAFNHILGSSRGNWLIPALHVVCRNTHRAAVLADEALSVNSGKRNDHAKLQNAVTLLQASYSKTLNDRVELKVSIMLIKFNMSRHYTSTLHCAYLARFPQPSEPLSEEGSKKVGVLYIVNQLFSMYFQLNTLRLCKNLLK